MIHFEEKDRQALLAFLGTDSGSKVIPFLRETKRPKTRRSGDAHEMTFDAGRADGFEDALDEVEILSRKSEKKERITADRPALEHTRRT